MNSICEICGGTDFSFSPVLWDELVEAWGLSPEERHYIDRQQGEYCTTCGANLRSIALAAAIRHHCQMGPWLRQAVGRRRWRKMRILELNGAGSLSPLLAAWPGHVRGDYPDVDMQDLPYETASFDLVVHSDTLEHVPDPVRALTECRRVLVPGGACCFTIPIVVGRLSRRREGLPGSWHGQSGTREEDWKVQTEYGADAWCEVMEAGFSSLTLLPIQWPAAIGIAARV